MTDVKITALEATEPKTNIVASHSLIAFQKSAQQRTESSHLRTEMQSDKLRGWSAELRAVD